MLIHRILHSEKHIVWCSNNKIVTITKITITITITKWFWCSFTEYYIPENTLYDVLELVHAWPDVSEHWGNVSVKNMFTLLPRFPDTGRWGKEQIRAQFYDSMQRPVTIHQRCASPNVIVCSVRDEILFRFLQLSALSYLSFALFMHFSREIFLHLIFVFVQDQRKAEMNCKNVSSSKFVLPL